jgi:inner membrane protein
MWEDELMCSVLTHPVVPLALFTVFPQAALSPTVLVVGAVCSVVPDLDVIGRKFGIRSNHMLGHRGLTHSIAFATALGAILTHTLFRSSHLDPWVVFLFLFVSTLSHALLDMLTNGGQGVALWAPFSNARYFFPWRPIEVSPIGVRRFFSRRGGMIIRSEFRWVWLPLAGVYILGIMVRRYG